MADAIAEGDQACEDASVSLGEIEKGYTAALNSEDYAGAADGLDEIIALSGERNETLAGIQVEGAEQETLDSYVANLQETEDVYQTMSDSIRDEDIVGVTDATKEIVQLNVEAQALAQEFGFELCSSGATGAA